MKDILNQIHNALQKHYPEREAKAIARLILEIRFDITVLDICMGKVKQFSEEERRVLENILDRLAKKEPIQYVLGETFFCGLPFKVAPGVLIPRPETEELVEWILTDTSTDAPQILDIGTGSGCIALALSHKLPLAKVTACDISPEALAIAKENAENLHLDIQFKMTDILQYHHIDTLDPKSTSLILEKPESATGYDIIVSNPPYVCTNEADLMEEHVLAYEPHLALFVPDDNPLLFYHAIAHFAWLNLKADGTLYLEINQRMGRETKQFLQHIGFNQVEIRKDFYGNDRMIKCSR